VLGRRVLGEGAVEVTVELGEGARLDGVRGALFGEGARLGVDCNIQTGDVWGGRKRLAVFDLDSTLIAEETIDELAAEVGREVEVREITRRAMEGEVGFRDALEQRVALLKGLDVARLAAVTARVTFTPGAHRLAGVLRSVGCETAVVSGGFDFLAGHVRDVLRLDHSFANRLEVAGGVLTGRTVGDIVDAEYKAATLTRLAEARGLAPEQVIAVGDGSNDIPMIARAGLGVAFNAKPVVQSRAPARVNQASLVSVLHLLGMTMDEIDAVDLAR
jgi:phosphoserine phosphatase